MSLLMFKALYGLPVAGRIKSSDLSKVFKAFQSLTPTHLPSYPAWRPVSKSFAPGPRKLVIAPQKSLLWLPASAWNALRSLPGLELM